MKTKNPLYVVKGKDVLEASSLFDLMVKKFNLGPVLEVIQNLVKMLLDQVKTYPAFVVMKNYIDELIAGFLGLVKKFSPA